MNHHDMNHRGMNHHDMNHRDMNHRGINHRGMNHRGMRKNCALTSISIMDSLIIQSVLMIGDKNKYMDSFSSGLFASPKGNLKME